MLRKATNGASAAALALVFGLIASGVRAEPTTAPVAPAGKASVVVTVVDGDGKPATGATVDLMPASVGRKKAGRKATGAPLAADPPTSQPAGDGTKPPKAEPLASAVTDADGKATLTGIADGAYSVRARLKKVGNGRIAVTVADGKDAAVTVTLKAKAAK